MGLPVGLIGPPFPPFTNNDFLSAVAILLPASAYPHLRPRPKSLVIPTNVLVIPTEGRNLLFSRSVHSHTEDRQIQRDEHSAHENRHNHQNDRLNQRHRCSQRRLHVFLIKLGNRVQHRRQRSGGFTHFDHFHRQIRKNFLLLQAARKSLSLAHPNPRPHHTFYDAPAAHRSARRFHRRHQRQSALQQSRKHPRKTRHLVLQPDVPQQRNAQDHAVNAVRAAIGIFPTPQHESDNHQPDEHKRSIFLRVLAHREHEQGDRRQLLIQTVEQVRKLGHNVGKQERHHDQHHGDQQSRIDQRHEQLLAERHGRPLEADVAGQHLVDVAALLARHQGRGVNLGNDPLRRKRVGEQLSAFDALPHVLQKLLQLRVLLPLDEQFERVQDGQPGPDQGQELLVKHQKRTLLQLPPPAQRNSRRQHSLGLNPVDEITLLREAVAHLGFRVALLDVLLDPPAIVRDFYYKFRHLPTFLLVFQRYALPLSLTFPLTILRHRPPLNRPLLVPQVTSMAVSLIAVSVIPKWPCHSERSRGTCFLLIGHSTLRLNPPLHRLGPRRRLEVEPSIPDRHVFFHLANPVFRSRSIHFLDDNPRNLVVGRDLQQNLADTIRQRLRYAAQDHVARRQRRYIW